MLILLIVCAHSLTCKEKLEEYFFQDLQPRIYSFNSEGKGLDHLSAVDQCKVSKNSIYMLLQWQKMEFPLVSYGFCLPDECSAVEVNSLMTSETFSYLQEIQVGDCSTKLIDLKRKPEYSVFSVIFFVMFFALVLVTCISTWISNSSKVEFSELSKSSRNLSENFLAHFDLIKNSQKFFDFRNNFDNLGFFDGIRMICSISILMIHTYFFSIFLPLSNRKEFNETINSFFFTVLGYFNYSVDIFFFIAGFLMCILTLAEIKSKGEKFSWCRCLVRRLIRYLPCYFFVVGIDRVFPQGSPDSIGTVNFYLIGQKSSENWWKNLLFVQNLFLDKVPPHLPWTWTIAADFQFYLTSLLIVYTFTRNKSAAIFAIFLIVSASLAYTAFVSDSLKIFVDIFELATNPGYLNLIYFAFWTRIPPFLIGVFFGFMYRLGSEKGNIEKNQSFAYRIARFLRNCAFDAGLRQKIYRFSGVLNVLICVFPSLICYFDKNPFFLVFSTTWISISRTAVTISFASCIYPMMFGHSKRFSVLFCSRICKFFSKISYSFYLIHPLVIGAINMSINTHLKLTLWDWMLDTLSIILYSSIVAVILSILIESPFFSIEKQFLGRK